MPSMTSPYKHPKSGTYYFRRGVPADIQDIVGRKLLKVSLKTKDPQEAKRLIVSHIAESDEQFRMARLRADQGASQSLTAKDAAIVASRWYECMKEKADNTGGDIGVVSKVTEDDGSITFERASILFPVTGSEIHTASPKVLDRLSDMLSDFIDDQLRIEHLSIPKGTEAYRWLAKEFYSYWYDLEALCKARLVNDWTFKPAQSIAGETLSIDRAKATKAPSPPGEGPKLSEVLDMYLTSEKAKVGNQLSRLKTLDSYAASYRRFIEVVGDLKLDTLTTQHVMQFREIGLQLPKSKSREIRSMAIMEQVTYAQVHKLVLVSPSTVKNTLKHVSTVLNYAIEAEYIDTNPVQKVKKPKSRQVTDASELERGYTEQDLKQIFSHGIFNDPTAHKRHGQASYWIPLICRYTGARLNEIGQLDREDIQQEDGIHFFNIRRGEGQSVKSNSSVRYVPIHQHLIDLGLLDYVNSISQGALFPQVPRDKKTGSTTGALSKWWAAIVREQGVNPKAPAHEFRHTVKTELRGLGVPDSVSDRITGHSSKGEGGRYGSVPLSVRQEVINQLTSLKLGTLK